MKKPVKNKHRRRPRRSIKRAATVFDLFEKTVRRSTKKYRRRRPKNQQRRLTPKDQQQWLKPLFYTVKEAAFILRCSEKQVRRYVARGLLRKSDASRRVLIFVEDVQTFPERTK